MQIKTTPRCHIISIRLANMTKQENDKCWRRCGKIGTLMHCWWTCELIQPFWRAIWNYTQRAIKWYISFDPEIPPLGLSQRDHKNRKRTYMYKNVYNSSFCVGQELETEGMPINWGMAEQIVVYEYNGVLLCYKKWWAGRFQENLERLTWTNAEWSEQNHREHFIQ